MRRFTARLVEINARAGTGHSVDVKTYCSPLRRVSARLLSSMSEEGEAKSEAPSGFIEITEGRAKILFPSSNEVFYNPVQEFNRDLR